MTENSLTGSIELAFLRVSKRYGGVIRCVLVALISVFGVVAAPAEALPLSGVLAGFAVAIMVVECLPKATVIRRRVTDVLGIALAVAICLAQPWTSPGPGTYHANEWAFNVVAVTASTIQWQWRLPITAFVIALLLGADVLGRRLGEHPSGAVPAFLIIRVLLEVFLARACFWFILRNARRLDRQRGEQEQLEREMALATARRKQEREHLALLHDTAAATLLLAAREQPVPDPDLLARYAHRDLAILTGQTQAPGATDALVDFSALIGTVVDQSPLSIETRIHGRPRLPPEPALAMLRALREALTNIERHAGVTTGSLRVTPTGPGVVLEISDDGCGFDPQAVSGLHRGISSSIVERLAGVGGRAMVTTCPGVGTLVRLEWPDG